MHNKLFRYLLCLLLFMLLFPVAPLLAQPPQGKKIVVIDPAHGGSDPGVKISGKVQEKDITLAVALLMEKELAGAGNIKVYLTRSTDTEVSLGNRLKAIKSLKADALISLHVNAGFDKKATGFEIYYPGFKVLPGGQNDSKAILKDMVKNKYLNDSVKLAHAVSRNLATVFPRKDRGLREASLSIMEGLTIPALVIEMGFVTHADDRDKLTNENTQQAIAKALSKSLRDNL